MDSHRALMKLEAEIHEDLGQTMDGQWGSHKGKGGSGMVGIQPNPRKRAKTDDWADGGGGGKGNPGSQRMMYPGHGGGIPYQQMMMGPGGSNMHGPYQQVSSSGPPMRHQGRPGGPHPGYPHHQQSVGAIPSDENFMPSRKQEELQGAEDGFNVGDLFSTDADQDDTLDGTNPSVQPSQSFVTSEEQSTAPSPGIGAAGESEPLVPLKSIATLEGHEGKITCCAFSPEAEWLATAGHDKKTLVWNVATYERKQSFDSHQHSVLDVRFSPHSSVLATASMDKQVKLWNCVSGRCLGTLVGHSAAVTSVDFHPVNKDILCSSDVEGELRYWKMNSSSSQQISCVCTGNLEVASKTIRQAQYNPSGGKLIAVASDNHISIFDVETKKLLHQLVGHQKPITAIAWQPNTELLVSTSDDSTRLWSPSSARSTQVLNSMNRQHSCVFYNETTVAIGAYQTIELWNFAENKQVSFGAHEGMVSALARSGNHLASASHDFTAKLWEAPI
jgi:WD40 repeat protein